MLESIASSTKPMMALVQKKEKRYETWGMRMKRNWRNEEHTHYRHGSIEGHIAMQTLHEERRCVPQLCWAQDWKSYQRKQEFPWKSQNKSKCRWLSEWTSPDISCSFGKEHTMKTRPSDVTIETLSEKEKMRKQETRRRRRRRSKHTVNEFIDQWMIGHSSLPSTPTKWIWKWSTEKREREKKRNRSCKGNLWSKGHLGTCSCTTYRLFRSQIRRLPLAGGGRKWADIKQPQKRSPWK